MQIACLRCSTLTELVVSDDAGMAIDGSADVENGMLTYICHNCMTSDEMMTSVQKSTVTLLDAAEETIEVMDMMAERLPGFKENLDFKAQYAEAQQMAEKARTMLRTLLGDG